jgi:L-2-hydroxycarboxylate dehydrogenase (NAD+)
MNFSYEQLFNFSKQIFMAIGCPEKDAHVAATSLLRADLRGVESHGVARLSGYVRLHEAARLNAAPNISIVHERPSTAVIDGDGGLGLVVAPIAMELAIKKASQAGTGWVAVRNSNHYGIAGHYASMALPHDMIGISMTNASPLVAPTYSKERLLGTNPIAIAIPAQNQPAFIGDFATTTAANGKLEILQRKNLAVPNGWVQSKEGNESNDAFAVQDGGALLPLGSHRELGSHKGFILGSMVDILSGVLGGANYGPWVPPFVAFLPVAEDLPGKGIGHFFGAISVDAFRPAADFKKDMDQWITRFRNATPINETQKVVIPGDPERVAEAFHLKEGITLLDKVVADLKQLGEKYKVAL